MHRSYIPCAEIDLPGAHGMCFIWHTGEALQVPTDRWIFSTLSPLKGCTELRAISIFVVVCHNVMGKCLLTRWFPFAFLGSCLVASYDTRSLRLVYSTVPWTQHGWHIMRIWVDFG